MIIMNLIICFYIIFSHGFWRFFLKNPLTVNHFLHFFVSCFLPQPTRSRWTVLGMHLASSITATRVASTLSDLSFVLLFIYVFFYIFCYPYLFKYFIYFFSSPVHGEPLLECVSRLRSLLPSSLWHHALHHGDAWTGSALPVTCLCK